MHDLTDGQLVEQFLAHVQPRGGLTQDEAATTLSRLGGTKIHQTTISRWLGQGAKRLESHTRHGIERFLAAGGEAAMETPAEDEWTHFSLETVRYAGGNEQWTDEQRRLIKLDVLEGLIRLGVAEGRDVRVLQDEQRRLYAAGPLNRRLPGSSGEHTRVRPSDVLALYQQESAAAMERAIGMRHLSRAAELEAEESRARRIGLADAELPGISDAEAYAIAEQGAAAAEIARAAERASGRSGASSERTSQTPPDGTRRSGP